METKTKFEQWALVDLFGHQKIAGFVTDETIGGATFIRVDVPKVKDGCEGFTRFYNPQAVYGISPVTEFVAKELARKIDSRPIVAWDIGFDPQRSLPFQPVRDDDDDDGEQQDDDY